MKGVDHADQYLRCYSVDKKNSEVVKESVVISTKLYTLGTGHLNC
jgi:hypothetical protein